MAGVKGRSGGPRANSGGRRPGAGRKPNPIPEPVLIVPFGTELPLAEAVAAPESELPTEAPAEFTPEMVAVTQKEEKPVSKQVEKPSEPDDEQPVNIVGMDMLQILQAVAMGQIKATPLQVRAAIAAVQYTHTKKHDGGKKDEANERAAKVAAGGKFTAAAPPRLVANNK